jgi:hypothetical protein
MCFYPSVPNSISCVYDINNPNGDQFMPKYETMEFSKRNTDTWAESTAIKVVVTVIGIGLLGFTLAALWFQRRNALKVSGLEPFTLPSAPFISNVVEKPSYLGVSSPAASTLLYSLLALNFGKQKRKPKSKCK